MGKNRALLEAALGQAAAEEAERGKQVRLHLTTGIRLRVFPRPCVYPQFELVRAIVDLRRKLRQLAQTRFQLGLDNELALKQAIADYEAAVKRQAGVRDQLDVQRHLLARLTGKGPDEGLSLFNRSESALPRLSTCAGTPPNGIAGAPSRSGRATLYKADSAASLAKSRRRSSTLRSI